MKATSRSSSFSGPTLPNSSGNGNASDTLALSSYAIAIPSRTTAHACKYIFRPNETLFLRAPRFTSITMNFLEPPLGYLGICIAWEGEQLCFTRKSGSSIID